MSDPFYVVSKNLSEAETFNAQTMSAQSLDASQANISEATISSLQCNTMNATIGTISTLSCGVVNSTTVNFTSASGSTLTASSVNATDAIFSNVTSSYGTISNLNSTNISASSASLTGDLTVGGTIKKAANIYTLPNKSGTFCMLSDLPDMGDVMYKSTNQTVSGQKTFTANPIISGILKGGITYSLPNKLVNSTLATTGDIPAPPDLSHVIYDNNESTITGIKHFSIGLDANKIDATQGNLSTCNATTSNSTTANATTLNATTANISTATMTTANITTGTISTLFAPICTSTNCNITNLTATSGTITSLSAPSFRCTTANVDSMTVTSLSCSGTVVMTTIPDNLVGITGNQTITGNKSFITAGGETKISDLYSSNASIISLTCPVIKQPTGIPLLLNDELSNSQLSVGRTGVSATTFSASTLTSTNAHLTTLTLGSLYSGTNALTLPATSGTLALTSCTNGLISSSAVDAKLLSYALVSQIPDISDMVTKSTSQTISGVKTFSANPVISAITNIGTLTLPTTTGTVALTSCTEGLISSSAVDAKLLSYALVSQLPDISDMVTKSTNQTISGVKTFSASPVISTITNVGTLTLPTTTGTLALTTATNGLISSGAVDAKLSSYALVSQIPDVSDMVTKSTNQTISGVKTFSNAPVISTITNVGTLTLPTTTGTLALTTATNGLISSAAVDAKLSSYALISQLPDISDMVTKSTNQTISGVKTFSSQAIFSNGISNGTYSYTLPSKTGTLACLSDITAPDLSNYVTLDSKQITGEKTFSAISTFSNTTPTLGTNSGAVIISGGLGCEGGGWFGGGNVAKAFSTNIGTNSINFAMHSSTNLKRWTTELTGADTGSNVGSDYEIKRWDDTGTTSTSTMSLSRSTGNVTLSNGIFQPCSMRFSKNYWYLTNSATRDIVFTFAGTSWWSLGGTATISGWSSTAPHVVTTHLYLMGAGKNGAFGSWGNATIAYGISQGGASIPTMAFLSNTNTSATFRITCGTSQYYTFSVLLDLVMTYDYVNGATFSGVTW